MGRFAFLSIALLSVQALLAQAEDATPDAPVNVAEDVVKEMPTINVNVSTTFPNSEVFGVKLVNGLPTNAQLKFINNEPEPVTVSVIGGSLWTLSTPAQNVRNLTTSRPGIEVASNSEATIGYDISTELLPQDLALNLAAVVSRKDGLLFTIPAFDGPVSIVEPAMSIFDPQVIFLYVVVLGSFVGACYLFYTLWIAPYFPQKRKPAKAHDRTKKSSRDQTGVDSGDQAPETPAVAKSYDTEWIPAHHINRPEARKVKSGSGKAKNRA
ncbi:hypothetical protein LOZ53_002024 [Ophidiomyces ophidiicola]|nr:hypothetical protein LOZ55_003904 [Ophidiomyces ophidiicola]KAI1985010.1 hypothetical protein LOZ51_006544 [Ophidiomyces ophidiicola]KAI1993812.1 hypothetical protein LOZ53_002024 [Ophidiomyces ophidiicola]